MHGVEEIFLVLVVAQPATKASKLNVKT